MKKYFIILAFVTGLASWSGVLTLFGEEKPNIILVMTDDQGYPVVGAHGHPWIETPVLDKMYENSVRFDRFMMGSTCAPSRAGIMTGSHSIRNGVTHTIYERERLNLKATTIAEVLKPAGYSSGYFGKWHLGDEEPYQPENRGFDETFIHGAGGIGQAYAGSCADVPNNKYFDPVFKENGSFVKTKGYCTDILFQATLAWVQEMNEKDQPFFALLSTNAPHSPFIAPPEYQKKFEELGFNSKVAGFYGMVEHIDYNMGILFKKLEEWGMMDNTIVIFTSDNGMTRIGCGLKGFGGRPQVKLGKSKSGEPMMSYNAGMKGLKGTVDEGGVRVPFFVQWNKTIQEGRTVETVASYLDILPTLADIAGAELPEGHLFEGRSLTPFLTQENPEWSDRYLFQHVTRWDQGVNPDDFKWKKFSVRNQRFRLVENSNSKKGKKELDAEGVETVQVALYDMLKDPEQNNDVSSEYPEVVAEMLKGYEAFWDSVRPCMINDGVPLAKEKPFHVDYYAQEKSRGIPDWKAPVLK
ncbi:arylsulfatase [Coraliomargarita sp. SDUM461003]|uniref:Arylsulfatase n=1 Tax=Thalassobacterium maritimum TaxID=3041265 RepID=A0ABU1ATB4_9BACT|nr:arylsulfatase [Coraliomargarita sp. SDUM461003]MDQ8207389.1 arylsulfatase [Coraliomargarita sp. SDUM461003]